MRTTHDTIFFLLYHGLFSTVVSRDTVVGRSFYITGCSQHLFPSALSPAVTSSTATLFSTVVSADTVVFVSRVVLRQQSFPRTQLFLYHGLCSGNSRFRGHCCFCITGCSPATVVSGDTVVGRSFCITGCSQHLFPQTLLFLYHRLFSTLVSVDIVSGCDVLPYSS